MTNNPSVVCFIRLGGDWPFWSFAYTGNTINQQVKESRGLFDLMKPILCLEATWFENSPVTVRPFLETLYMIEGIPFTRRACNTPLSMRKHLQSYKPKKPGILYFAMHGHPGSLVFDDTGGSVVTLDELAGIMGRKFKNWHVHFASCQTINVNQNTFVRFKESTCASLVSGYTKQVDWIEGYALDMLLLQKSQNYARSGHLINFMYNNYNGLMNRTGMYLE